MKILRSNLKLDAFFRKVAASDRQLLLLDYDGTLAPFRTKRDEAVPYPGIRGIIEALIDDGGSRVILVSGRPVKALLPLLAVDPTPEIWGSHGWEHLSTEGGLEYAPLPEGVPEALGDARSVLERLELADRCEEKHGCLALHWRGMEPSEIEELRGKIHADWNAVAEKSDLSLIDFDGGIELRARGRDKAFVVRTVLSEMGRDTICSFLGDDASDEEAFRELGDEHLGVLVREEFRPTAADLWLQPPLEVIDFLERWKDASTRQADRNPAQCSAEHTSNRGDLQ